MIGINEVTLVGRLGQDPERRGGDRGPLKMSIATDRRVKDGDDWKTVTDWHSVTVWGKDAENCEKYLQKGSTVAVKARLEVRKWDSDNGPRKEVDIVAEKVIFLDSGKGGGGNDRGRDRDDRDRDDRRESRGRDDDRGRDRDRGRDDDRRGGRDRDERDDRRASKDSKGGKKREDEGEAFDSDVPF